MKLRNETYTNGVLVLTTFAVLLGIGSDRPTIPADNTTPVTVHWAGVVPITGASVVVSVNGLTQSLATTRDVATGLDVLEFEVVAPQVGLIEIIVNALDTLTIQAV